jgi:hypothetical protein
MRSKAETLSLIITELIKPLEGIPFSLIPDGQPRRSDPLWQVGHAAFDAVQAFVLPFDSGNPVVTRFSDCFHGRRAWEPWLGPRPGALEVLAWWKDIVRAAEHTLNTHGLDETLPEPVAFTAYTVYSLAEAFDYVIYHTSFHIGIAHAKLGLR